MTGQSATVIARWPLANPQSAIPLLGRALTVSRPGTSLGRRAVQIKPYRMPASHEKQGRNMYVVREHDGAHDNLAVLVEDPNAPLLAQLRDHANGGKGKGKATQDSDDDDDDILFVDPGEDKKHTPDQHSRWTYCSIAQPLDAPGGDSASAASLFDSFIQRALFPPPQPGGAAAGGGAHTSASSAANSRRDANGNGNAQYWQPRAQVVSIEGFVFALTSGGGAGGNTAGVSPDWIVKVGSATYLPVPYLPSGSTFARDFVLSLFPAAAVRNGEIELVEPSETDFFEAGMLDLPDPAKGEEEGEWEWQGKHTFYTYVHQFKKEGIL
ncbi:hypothetical protein RHOSPDRAFT_31704 [Rhodotorula sp. JG-1b]|nr:hypothetical protein RHOSPDRAFT_31704 [Rhodotorula sp. JG-1b]